MPTLLLFLVSAALAPASTAGPQRGAQGTVAASTLPAAQPTGSRAQGPARIAGPLGVCAGICGGAAVVPLIPVAVPVGGLVGAGLGAWLALTEAEEEPLLAPLYAVAGGCVGSLVGCGLPIVAGMFLHSAVERELVEAGNRPDASSSTRAPPVQRY